MTGSPLLERILRIQIPKPDLHFTPPPGEIGPGIWSVDRQVVFGGAPLPTRSTVIDLGSRRLLVISPPADGCPELDRLGVVSAIVAPNSFHYLYVEAYARRYPDAQLFVAPELPRRVPSLPRSVELTASASVAWRDALPYLVLGPDRGLSEVLFFHVASRTLILTDAATNLQNLGAYPRLLARLSGLPLRFGPGRTSRQLLLREPKSVREVLRKVAQWPFERIVMAHGAVVERDARAAFTSAFAPYL